MAKSKKRAKPFDPAAAARLEAETRNDPSRWGVNEAAMAGEANADVGGEDATRTKVRRVLRYDVFSMLVSRSSIDAGQLAVVRRLQDDVAVRFRVDGLVGGVSVDGGAGTPVSERSLQAAERIEAVMGWVGFLSSRLLISLIEPAARSGQPVQNWRAVVKAVTGEDDDKAQTAMVRMSTENLRVAYQRWDAGDRPAPKRRAGA